MAEEVNQRVEDALQTLVRITERKGNLRKDLKNDILVSVSTLREEISLLKTQLENVNNDCKKLREEVKNAKEKVTTGRDSQLAGQVATSLDHRQQPLRGAVRQDLPSGGGRRKLFSEAVKKKKKTKGTESH